VGLSADTAPVLGPLTRKQAASPYQGGLPTQLVRDGGYGETWDLPRRFRGFTATYLDVSMSGTTPKCFLTKGDSLSGGYIAKFAEKGGPIETYTELFNNQLGMALGFNMAHSGIATLDGMLHFVSRSFIDNNEQLLHGSLLVEEAGLANRDELSHIKSAASQQGVYDVDFVQSVIYQVCDKHADEVFAAFVEMLVFDALIGSMDRHPRNWGVLRSATLPTEYRFSPLYDSARALLWNTSDAMLESLEQNEAAFQGYLRRACPRIGLPMSSGHTGTCKHVDLIRYLLKQHKTDTLRAYEKIDVNLRQAVEQLLRRYPFRRVFSRRRGRLILRLLEARQQQLLHLISSKEGEHAISLGI